MRPGGEIVFPSASETLNQQSYEAVVRTDRTVDEVWIHLTDSETGNDDLQTRVLNGNGLGFEPFTDTNRNGTRQPSEPYEDLNLNGNWDNNLTESWVKATPVQPNPFVSSSFPKEWRFSFRNIPAAGTAQIKVRLKEVSSSSLQTLSDAAGHYTTLTRTVNTAGPATRLFVAFPQADGEQVGDDYVLKAYFSKSLGESVSDAQLINEFLVQIGSSVSGTPANATTQPRNLYAIVRNETPDYHALAFTIPSLYNGDPDFLHHIGISHTRASTTLNASRVVRAAVTNKPFLSITQPPAVGSDGRPYEVVLPAIASPTPDDRAMTVRVDTDLRAEQVTLTSLQGMGTIVSQGVQVSGNSKTWQFRWTGLVPGRDRLLANAALSVGGPVSSSMEREVTIVLRQIVPENPTDADDDDDGIPDSDETTRLDLPTSNSETWNNGEIHFWRITGRTNPVAPDSDDDLVPDGLEVGIASNFIADTNIATDTDGDGFKNFIADVDPPIFNTTDRSAHPRYDFNRGRTDQIGGSMTDPTKPDTDDDFLLDRAEDANRNGRVDIALLDGSGVAQSIIASPTTVYNTSRVERSSIPSNGLLLETDPNNPDTDADGAPDGAEDANGNGRVDMQLVTSAMAAPVNFDISLPANASYLIGSNLANQRSRAINRTALAAAFPVNGYPRLLWAETDPLNPDTDGDGLPDQWEITHGLDPLVSAAVNLRTGGLGLLAEGSGGDPDGDGFTNLQEFTNGTKPKVADTVNPPSANSIVIGPKDNITLGQAINEQAFTDWTREDLVSFDESEGSGSNNQGGDTFLAFDGFDSSRDLVAFYARDGGADGYYYFRVDLHDLRAQAEQGNLDIYVVVDTGNPLAGEAALPEDVDIRTAMRWEAIVACYQTNQGRVFVDTNPTVNSNSANQALTGPNGVVVRDQNSSNGFGASYFNHELDAAEFSIKRQALLDAGWNGTSRLNFQVFTTRDGTNNTGANGPGLGDIGGRNDLRDTITDDFLSEDYFSNQANIANNGVLSSYLSVDGAGLYPDQRKSAKMIMLTHGHQPILPAAETQRLINSGFSTGYHRAIDAHQAFARPLTLHLTPPLASAMQWAAVDPSVNRPWRDGPSFMQRLGDEMRAGRINLLGTTFSDHMVRYFDPAFNLDNRNLAVDTMNDLLGYAPSASVFWNPERVADGLTFQRISGMGYSHTFIDQMRHLFKWQGRDAALSDDGYRINRYHGVNCFVINDQASSYRSQNLDSGFPMPWRNLFLRKARSDNQQQVVVIQNWWEEFSNNPFATTYDRNLRWAANRPWIQLVTADQIVAGQVDTNRDLLGDAWSVVDRGSPALSIVSQDWIDHATQENYDHWYFGQAGREEGLSNKRFEIRAGVLLPAARTFGHQAANDGKLADLVFDSVAALNGSYGTRSPRNLARATAHTSVLLTAFHEQSDSDLTKYSTGVYINPDTTSQSLALLSTRHQSQIRHAAIYQQVQAWAENPPAVVEALALDVDLDGEQEYLLRNDRVMALFEAIGGRMTASWARDPENGSVYQLSGNFLAQADGANESEGTINHDGLGNTGAKRTSGFKDWFAHGVNQSSVNGIYTVTPSGTNAWTFTSANGNISKTISLSNMSTRLRAQYALSGGVNQLSVRFGLSPHLEKLVSSGQRHLFSPPTAAGAKTIFYQKNEISVRASIHTSGPGLSGSIIQDAAIDDAPAAVPLFDSDALPRRNQAYTEQVELFGSGPSFVFDLELVSENNDADQDGLPDDWETLHSLATNDDGSINIVNGPNGDPDSDGFSNGAEWLLGMNPRSSDLAQLSSLKIDRIPTGFRLSYPTIANRIYQLETSETLQNWVRIGSPLATPKNALSGLFQFDDSTNNPRKFYRMTVRANSEP
ncbi:MAG: hypothetical protein EAZ42_06040 [Verrucomicrobia bacterium]|nr:MAG: hypothetical protein EAZ42_06040 [Verrucomicrobiota bacterium]